MPDSPVSMSQDRLKYLSWVDQLHPLTKQRLLQPAPLSVEAEEVCAFQQFRDGLLPSTKAAIITESSEKKLWPQGRKPFHILFAQEDGEWAQQHLFGTEEALAEKVRKLDGTDTVVFAVFGIPVVITQGPERLIIFPSGNAYTLGRSKIEKVKVENEVTIQTDGFLGEAQLAECLAYAGEEQEDGADPSVEFES